MKFVHEFIEHPSYNWQFEVYNRQFGEYNRQFEVYNGQLNHYGLMQLKHPYKLSWWSICYGACNILQKKFAMTHVTFYKRNDLYVQNRTIRW